MTADVLYSSYNLFLLYSGINSQLFYIDVNTTFHNTEAVK